MNPEQEGFAFFNHIEGFSFIRKNHKQYYDLNYNGFQTFTGSASSSDSLIGKAYIQMLYNDYKLR